MINRRILYAVLCVGLSLVWAAPAVAQGVQCDTDINIVRIQTLGPIGGPGGMGAGQVSPLQVIGFDSTGQQFDVTRCVTWDEPTPDIVKRIADGSPTGSSLQTGALANLQASQITSGRLVATFKNNEGKVLSAHKLVTVSPSGAAPFRQFLVKAPPLPVAAPPPVQPASGDSGIADAGMGPLLLGLGVAGAVGLAAFAFSGLDSGGDSCPSNPSLSVIVASCSCSPYSFLGYVSCSGGGGGSDCKQCGN